MKNQSWIALFFVLILGIFSSKAQDQFQLGSDPIILKDSDGLWAFDVSSQSMISLVSRIGIERVTLSPDGNRVAYSSQAPIFTEWLVTVNGAGGFQVPEDLWIFDLSSGENFALAEQASDASFNGPNAEGQYILRSPATWSPDSQKLAWLEFSIEHFSTARSGELKVYDFVTGEISSFETFSFINQNSPSDNFDLTWGRTGLAFLARHFDSALSDLHVYDVSGNLVSSVRVETGQLFFNNWIQSETEDYLFNNDSLLNWQTGQVETMPDEVEMLSSFAEDGVRFLKILDGQIRYWYLALPGQAAIELDREVKPYGISRDGLCGLYTIAEPSTGITITTYTLVAQCGDNIIEYSGLRDVDAVWGPTIWQIASE